MTQSGSTDAEARRVAEYFDTHTQRYDELYGARHSLTQRLVDRFFHRVIRERFDLTFARAGNVAGKRVLDVGCGSGRYAVRFAMEGALVVGVDVSAGMLELATARARALGVADRCTFRHASFLDWDGDEGFDIITAIGLFDYVGDAAALIAKIRRHLGGDVFASFPIRGQVRAVIRRLSFLPTGCPINFYARKDVARLWSAARLVTVDLVRLDRDYFVHGRVAAPPS